MNNRFVEQIAVGSTLAFVTAMINQAVAGKISYLWILGGFLVAVVIYNLYLPSGYPFITYRVTNRNDGRGLLFHSMEPQLATGKAVGNAWQFKAERDANFHPIFGPYIQEPLRKGKYRATFRLRVDDDISGDDVHITKIDVVSNFREHRGMKELAARSLMARDFKTSGEYQSFHLDFEVFADEREVELRVYPTAGYLVTFDAVKLSRRLF